MKKSYSLSKCKILFCVWLFTSMFLNSGIMYSQTAQVIKKVDNKYHIKIDGKDYLAYPPEYIKEKLFERDSLEIELKAANQKLEADSSLIAQYDTTIDAYRKNIALKDSARVVYTNLYTGYRDLYFDYKKAYSDPWLYFSGGIGALRERGGDRDVLPVILLGLSVKKLTLWGFINNEQSGFILGMVQPIRFNFSLF